MAATKRVYIWVVMPFDNHTSMYFNGLSKTHMFETLNPVPPSKEV